jgi:hypothetical protein
VTRLSNRQYPLLKAFAEERAGYYMGMEEAGRFDQRPFRSMLVRRWVAYKPRHGFHITKDGEAAWREFQMTDILRKNPHAPLTAYFDPTAYGLPAALKKTA